MSDHRLTGLETDNLLGFLALLGLLRALEQARPQWSPRAYFSKPPLAASVRVVPDVTPEAIAEAAAEGCGAYAPEFAFQHYTDLTFGRSDGRSLLLESVGRPVKAEILSALFSDAAVKEKPERVIPTPLCAMFGQGHQSFLSRLTSVSNGTLPRALRNAKTRTDLNDPAFIYRALFEPWRRSDATESFRWDYADDRQYALRFADPSSDPPTTEHGANRLAVLGVLSFQSAPATRGLKADLATRAVSRGRKDRRQRITWPIWYEPASLNAIHTMLDEDELTQDAPAFVVMASYGVEQLRRVYRTTRGKYVSFTRAEPLTKSSMV